LGVRGSTGGDGGRGGRRGEVVFALSLLLLGRVVAHVRSIHDTEGEDKV